MTASAAVVACVAGASTARASGGCAPPLLTPGEVSSALHVPRAELRLRTARPASLPRLKGAAPAACDWRRVAGARDSGRASLFVFGSEADALAWFYTYRSGPRRSCRRVAIGSGGCLLPGTVKGLRRPTLDVVEGPYVVSVRVIQRTLDVAALRALALAVLAKAMSLR